MAIGSHHRTIGRSDEWLTPPWLLERLGRFDLDPCSPVDRPWPTATWHYTKEHDGLSMPWTGRVWCNPPYGLETSRWLEKMSRHGNGVALIFARTETRAWFKYVWPVAAGILFVKGRLTFFGVDGKPSRSGHNSGGPSALIAYGKSNAECLASSGIGGVFLNSWTRPGGVTTNLFGGR